MFVAATYRDAKEALITDGCGPMTNKAAITRECRVGWHFVEKVEGELLSAGHVISPEEIYRQRQRKMPTGPGPIYMDDIDGFVLDWLYQQQPTRSLASYVNWLFYYTENIVSKSTVSRFLCTAFPSEVGYASLTSSHTTNSSQRISRRRRNTSASLLYWIRFASNMETRSH